jgi:hypothetical protein
MTPTRALVGLAVVAAAGYAVISSAGGEGPKYLGDMPSIVAKASAAPPPVTHFGAGTTVPDPPHYAAHLVVPIAPAAPPPAVAGPGPVGPPAPAGSGRGVGNGEPSAQPGIGSPASNLLSGLLGGLPVIGALPPEIQALVDQGKYCLVGNLLTSCKVPPVPQPPVLP